MTPNAENYNPNPEYIRDLVESTGLRLPELGKVIGHDERTIRRWINGERKYPYSLQFALECLVLSPT
jgi:hypothetical protein